MINKKYFKYLFKSNFVVLIIFLILNLALNVFLPALNEIPVTDEGLYTDFSITIGNQLTNLNGMFNLFIIGSFILSFSLHIIYHKKNGNDVICSLPMTKKESIFTRILFVFSSMTSILLITFLFNIFIFLIKAYPYNYGYLFLGLTTMILGGLVLILVFHLSFLFANNMLDGLFSSTVISGSLVVFLALIGAFFYVCLVNPLDGEGATILFQNTVDYSLPLTALSSYSLISELSTHIMYGSDIYIFGGDKILAIIILVLKIIGYPFLISYFSGKIKSENAETPSVTNPTIIVSLQTYIFGAYTFISFMVITTFYDVQIVSAAIVATIVSLYLITFIVHIGLEMIVQRKFKIKLKPLIRIAAVICGGVGFGLIIGAILISKTF